MPQRRGVIVFVWSLGCTPDEIAEPSTTTGDETTGGTTGDATSDVPTSSETGVASTEGSTSAAAESSSGGETTSFKPLCGDRMVQGDEVCDDGNLVSEDGCFECIPGPVTEWCVSFDGQAHADDRAYGVATAADGGVYVVGSDEDAMKLEDIAVRRLAPDGALVWERIVAGPMGKDDSAYGVAAVADGAVVVGSMDNDGTVVAWARRYDDAGGVVWTFEEAGPPGPGGLNDLEVIGDVVYVVGVQIGAPQLLQAVVRRLDATTGAEVWQKAYDNGMSATANATALDGDDLIVAGSQGVGGISLTATVQRWTADGTLVSTWTWSAPEGDGTVARAVGALDDGTLVLAASTYEMGSDNSTWYLVGFAKDGTVAWQRHVADSWQTAHAWAIAADGAQFFAAGGGYSPNTVYAGLLARVAADGTDTLLTAISGGAESSTFNDVAVYADGLAVAAAGSRYNAAVNLDQWVCKVVP